MSPRAKVYLLGFLAVPLGLFGLVIALERSNLSLLILALLYVLLVNAAIEAVRCPQCDKSIAWSRWRLPWFHHLERSCLVGRYCVHCGYDLDQSAGGASGADGVKQYRISLRVVASPIVTSSELAALLRLPRAALTQERQGERVLWRYEPRAGQAGTLAHRLAEVASRLRLQARTQEELRKAGVERVSLGIDVRYDTFICTVCLPLGSLLSLADRAPELSTIELTCAPSDGPTRPASDAAKEDTNEYIVSLDAITSPSATVDEVVEALGLPPEAFIAHRVPDETIWTCEAEADRTTDLAEQIGQLISEAHPPQPSRPGGAVRALFLDLGVIWHVHETDRCAVSLPVPLLRSLREKLPVGYVRVRCYPGSGEESGDGCA